MAKQGARLPILVVDADPDIRALLAEQLAAGYDVALAADGVAAIQWLGEHRSSVRAVLLDPSLPGVSGFRVLEYLQWAGLRVPVLLHTADAQRAAILRRQRLPLVVAVLIKPVHWETLLVQLAMAVRQACE